MLLIAHPLHAYGPARDGHRHEGSIGRNIVGAIVSVAARSLHVDAMHLAFIKAKHFGNGSAQGKDALRMGPNAQVLWSG
jgi:hypothetical protein